MRSSSPNLDNAIWDDGEWITWDEINLHVETQELLAQFPNANPDVVRVFEDIVEGAARYHQLTGRYLQIWGELGELWAEIVYGIQRHAPAFAGSDGAIGTELVEVKTISPQKRTHKVQVKRAGNFTKLVVVRIDEHFQFESRIVDRAKLRDGDGKLAKVRWASLPED